MNEAPLANVECTFLFSIVNSNEENLFESEANLISTDLGNFTIVFQNIPSIFSDNSSKEMVDLVIVMSSDGEWLENGRFLLKYHLTKLGPESYNITRFEGQELNINFKHPIWEFRDLYPLAYLSSKFMISFNPDLTDPDKIIQACYELDPSQNITAPPSKSRGVKGGYAVGGYRSDQKKKD
jgi:hypothetical protein